MGFLANMFSTQKNSQTQSTANTNTQGNDWSQLQPFFQNYINQYSPANISSATVPINPYQTASAQAQEAVPAMTQPALATANAIGQTGIDPNSINKFMSPYISSVVNPMLQTFQQQQVMALNDLKGNQASQGALGNNTGSQAAYLASIQPQQEAQLASLYNTGYGQALGAAGQSTQAQLTGANTAGNIAGINTSGNLALGNLGQQQWSDLAQNALVPFSLYQSGAAGTTPFTQAAGSTSNTNQTGTTNTQSVPSVGGTVAGVAGAALQAAPFIAAMRAGGTVMPPRYATGGQITTPLGRLHERFAGEAPDPTGHTLSPRFSAHDDFVSKVHKAHDIVHAIRTKNTAASMRSMASPMTRPAPAMPMEKMEKPAMMPRFDMGGDVGLGSWGATVTPATGMSWQDSATGIGKSLSDLGKAGGFGAQDSGLPQQGPQQASATNPTTNPNASPSALENLLRMVRSPSQPVPVPGYDGGGGADGTWSDDPDAGPLPSTGLRSPEYLSDVVAPGRPDVRGLVGAIGSGARAMAAAPAGRSDFVMPPAHPGPAINVPARDNTSSIAGAGPSNENSSIIAGPENTPSSIAEGKDQGQLPWHLGTTVNREPAPPPPETTGQSIMKKLGIGQPYHGMFSGEAPTPLERFGTQLESIGRPGDPFQPAAEHAIAQQAVDRAHEQLMQEAELLPARKAQIEAQATISKHQGDIDYQIMAATKMNNLALVALLQKIKSIGQATDQMTPAQAANIGSVSRPYDYRYLPPEQQGAP